MQNSLATLFSFGGIVRTSPTPLPHYGIAPHEDIEIFLDRWQGNSQSMSDSSGLSPGITLD
ncbi:MAG: hypothetical protein M3R08_01335, partial [Bacteroidota bacterium]|nr:hypothetical protein [Bacteroidota bacterium]